MFHRVKSEVQTAEQQKQQDTDSLYQQQEPRHTSVPEAKDGNTVVEEKQERSQGLSYGKIQSKKQEETTAMAKREEAETVKRYGQDTEEDSVSEKLPTRGSYQPSIASTGTGYPGSYSGAASSYTPPQAPSDPYSAGDRVLTIGRGINMSGEIEACDHLMVEGTVEAALKGAKLLEIAESGTFYGTVEIEEATIAGRFEGDITVNGRLTLKASGVITGSIAYRELEVESGALIDGRMTPLKGNVDPKSVDKYRAGSEASNMAKPKETEGKKHSREPANTESGLFSRARDTYR